MSALAQVQPERDVSPRPTKRAALRAVPEPAPSTTWRRGTFPVLILTLLALGMVGHLFLQTKIQEQGFELSALQTQADQLSAKAIGLQAALDQASAPQEIARRAAALGMVANPYSTFLHLPSGQVTGVKKPVKGNEVPVISAPPVGTGTGGR